MTTAELVPTTGPTARPTLADKVAYAHELADSGLLPAAYRRNPANVLYAYEYADMLGLAPLAAITGVHVIEGKPTASAALISALVRRAGHRLRSWGDDQSATVEIVRRDDPEFTFRSVWTIERGVTAGLCTIKNGKAHARDGKGKPLPWEKFTPSMLAARATAECARAACEEALLGMHYTPEELGADVDEEGIPVRVQSTVVGAAPPAAGPAAAPEPPEEEPDWVASIKKCEDGRDRVGLVGLWKKARAMRPDDADLLRWITEAGERVKAAAAELEEVADADAESDDGVQDAEVVEDEDTEAEARREKRMHALLNEAGLSGGGTVRDRRLALIGTILRRTITTTADTEMSGEDRQEVIDTLERYRRNGDLDRAEECAQEDAAIEEAAAEDTEP